MLKSSKLVVIESPYAASTPEEVAANIEYARRAMADCLSRGEAPLASHLLYTQPGVLDDRIPEQRAQGMAAGLWWAIHADVALFYVDRGMSTGMLAAEKLYAERGTPVEYRYLEET